MSRRPLIYIITPVLNSKAVTLRFAASIKKQTYKSFKLVVVDDGSTDGTSKALAERHPEVKVLHGNGDLWWSGGTNKGVKYALRSGADYILTINHDVTLKSDYLSELVKCALEHPDSLIGSMVVNRSDKKSVWFFGAGYDPKTGLNAHTTGQIGEFTVPKESLWLTGMGVLIPARVFKKIGFYDDVNFPLYFGDADFSERARRTGFKLWVSPDAVVYGDINDNWIGRNVRRPRVRFIYDLFIKINSPFQWRTRQLYYKKYWPGNYRLALFKFYTIGAASIYYAYAVGLAKRLMRIT